MRGGIKLAAEDAFDYFSRPVFDESGYIREVAEQYGTDHEQFDLNPTENLAGAIEEFAYYSDEPTADAGALPIWFLSKLSKTKVTVTLSGEGGDEIFGGYLTYRANQLAHTARYLPQGSLRLALRALRAWPVSDNKISFEYKLKRFLGGCLRSGTGARVLERDLFRGAKGRARRRTAFDGARSCPGGPARAASRRRHLAVSLVRPEILFA